MKFICEKASLQISCSVASRATVSKSPIPALEGLLLEAAGELTITGYDLKKGIYTRCEAQIEEPGSVVVNARLFGEMIRKMPDGMICVSTDENLNVTVRCGKSEYRFMGISAEDYPEIPTVREDKKINVRQGLLRGMIEQTIYAVATSDIRPVYTGSLFETKEDELTIVSVDGFRLAKRTEKMDDPAEETSFVVPGSALADLVRVGGDEEDTVSISVGDKHISFTVGNTVVITRRLEGEFLNYKKSIPSSFRYSVEVEKAEFMSSIDRVSLIVNEKNSSPVHLIFGDGSIDCFCATPLGKAEDVCLCEGSGENMEIGFNDRYLMDAMKAAASDRLKISLNSPSSPCILTAADGSEKFTYMILPVRLRAGN